MLKNQLAGAAELPGATLTGRVVERQHEVGLGRQRDAPLDNLPRRQQVAQTDGREIGRQRCAEQGGSGQRGRDTGYHFDLRPG